jgi:hypothetical protein
MGLFGTTSSVSKMNDLLRKVELQINRVIAMKESNCTEETLRPAMREIGLMCNEAQRILENNSAARSITYDCMGMKVLGRNVPEFIKASMLTLTYMY